VAQRAGDASVRANAQLSARHVDIATDGAVEQHLAPHGGERTAHLTTHMHGPGGEVRVARDAGIRIDDDVPARGRDVPGDIGSEHHIASRCADALSDPSADPLVTAGCEEGAACGSHEREIAAGEHDIARNAFGDADFTTCAEEIVTEPRDPRGSVAISRRPAAGRDRRHSHR
jgi:hypothetical protein